jgi:hypothetical protein
MNIFTVIFALLNIFDKNEIINEERKYNLTSSIQSCSSTNSIASNIKLTMTPENPTIGSKYELDTSYDLSETITSGYANYIVKLSGFPVVNKKEDLCSDLKSGPTPCPLEKGHINSKISGVIPDNMPHGDYLTVIKWNTLDNNEILCLQLEFTV